MQHRPGARKPALATLTLAALAGCLTLPHTANAAPTPPSADDSAFEPAAAPSVTPSPPPAPPWIDDERDHQVTNGNTNGHLIHISYSDKRNQGWLQAYHTGDVQSADRWRFEEPVTVGRYTYFRMRNMKSDKCARVADAEVVSGYTGIWSWTCGSGDDFQWRAEPKMEGGQPNWNYVRFVSRSSRKAMRPWLNQIDQLLVLDGPGGGSNYYWYIDGG